MFSKAYWLGKLRMVLVLAAVVLLFVSLRWIVSRFREQQTTVTTMAADSQHPERYNDSLTPLNHQGQGATVLMENDRLSFAVDFSDGNIEVQNKENGYVWRSKPMPEEIEADQDTNDLWKANLQSPVIIEYVKSLTDSLSTIANASTPGFKIDVYQLPDGIRVDYQLTEQGIAVALDYYLHDDCLEVDLPNYMLRETPITYKRENGRLVPDLKVLAALVYRINVLPYFGAAQNTSDGFLLVPDGPGGLIYFDENRNYFTAYNAMIYGNDYSFYSFLDNTLGVQKFYSRSYFPAFGINRDDNGLLAVIHYGESNAIVSGTPAGVRTGFNNVSATFQYRNRYIKFHNLIGEGTLQFTENAANNSRNIFYYFLSEDDAGYAGMATAYRDYLIDTKGFERKQPQGEDIPFELTLYGGDTEENFIVSTFIPMTTFAQGKDIIEYFYEHGVREMNVTFDAWYKKGNSVRFPDRFPPAGQLGGTGGLQSLIDYTHDLGYKFFLTDWNLETSSTKGIVKSRDVVYDIQDTPMNWGTFIEPYYILNPTGMSRISNNSLKKYTAWDIDGTVEFDSDLLVSNQSRSNTMHREQAKNAINAQYQHVSDELGEIRIWRGMAYALVNGATVLDPAARYSFSPLIDEYVPFYHIAYRGLMDLVTVPVNTMNDIEYNLLKAAEYGQNISFELTWQPTGDLFYANNSWFLTSTQFEHFADSFLDLYGRYNTAFADTQGLFIVNHEKLADNVFRTTYENGKQIICNYRETAYEYKGVSIPSLAFVVDADGKVALP